VDNLKAIEYFYRQMELGNIKNDTEQEAYELAIKALKKMNISNLNMIEDIEILNEILEIVPLNHREVKVIKKVIQALEHQNKDRWIPVSERLPNDTECNEFDDMHPNHRKFLCTIKISDYEPQIRVLFLSEVFGWKYGADDYNEYVVAWKPLPESYKEIDYEG
jgi:hypothetical protein